MKKGIISLITSAAILSTLLFRPVYAAEDYIQNFNKTKSYTENQFSDIGSEWYAPSVQTVYEIGLMTGNSSNTFNPSGNLSNAEAVAVASRLHSVYNTGKDDFQQSTPWYQVYIDYAVSNSICSNNFDPMATADRSFFVGILGNAVNGSVLTQKNTINDGALYDVSGWYSSAVYSFYRAGVLSGNDIYGTFAPDTPITRAEAAAILVRIVKPSDRINVALQERPAFGTYSIMADDGSRTAYRQRALAANFEVLLGHKEKTPEWNSDTYAINSSVIKGTPSETIVIPQKYIDTRYDTSLHENCIAFKASHLDPTLSGEITIPIYFIQNGIGWNVNDRHYKLSVVNTGGKVDFFNGVVIQGDLQFYYPGENDIQISAKTLTYDNYTTEAQNMINYAPFTPQRINENEVCEFIKNTYGQNNQLKTMIGYLTDWNDEWYITMNNDDMYLPEPRENNKTNQTAYIFKPADSEIISWCKKNFGKYVIALVDYSIDSAGTPVMLAEINGYINTKDNAVIRSWSFDGSNLTIDYKCPNIEFTNPLIIYDNNTIANMKDTTGLLPAILHPLAPQNGNQLASYSYSDMYSLNFKDFVDKYFHMTVDGDRITIFTSSGSTVLTLTLNSEKAIIGGRDISYDFFGDPIISSEISGGKVETVTPPRKLMNKIYLPPEFIVNNLFKEQTSSKTTGDKSSDNEPSDLTGLAKVVYLAPSGGSLSSYCLEGYEDKKFGIFSNASDKYKYKVSVSYQGPSLYFNLDSTKAQVYKYIGGSSGLEYEEYNITIQEPKKIYNDIYLPVDAVMETLFSD